MKVLAFDTATPVCSVAVVTASGTMVEMSDRAGTTHARQLMVMIAAVLRQAELTVDDLDGFGVTVGPGSFTGLRIGVSSAQGLAMGSGKPAVGISALEALARQVKGAGLRCAMLDARRKEVYAAAYRLEGIRLTAVQPPCVAPPGDLVSALPAGCRYIGNGARHYRDTIHRHDATAIFPDAEADHYISAATVGQMALERLVATGEGSVPLPMPGYIRKSDAELLTFSQSLNNEDRLQV